MESDDKGNCERGKPEGMPEEETQRIGQAFGSGPVITVGKVDQISREETDEVRDADDEAREQKAEECQEE